MKKDTQEIIDTLKKKDKIRVLFVCLGNICRSPAAEGVLRDIVEEKGDENRWKIDSAGTGGYHVGDLPDRRMRVHASHRGLNLTHICRQVKYADFEKFDLIIAMDANNEYDLRNMAPTAEDTKKIVQMADFFTIATRYDYVPDPYYEGAEGFELVLDLLQDACRNLYEKLTEN